MDSDAARVSEALDTHGLLLLHDARLPSVTTLVAGAPVRGSWWGHPAGRRIYDVLGRVEAAWPKLLGGKVTLVHRRLWPALAAVGEQDAPWQLDGLDEDGRAVLDRVRTAGELRSDELGRGTGPRVTDLERRLLLVAEEVHTDDGHHARVLRTWARWLPDAERPPAPEARLALEQAAASLGARSRLPW